MLGGAYGEVITDNDNSCQVVFPELGVTAWMPSMALLWWPEDIEAERTLLEEEAENTATESSLGAASKTPVVEEQRGQDSARSSAPVHHHQALKKRERRPSKKWQR